MAADSKQRSALRAPGGGEQDISSADAHLQPVLRRRGLIAGVAALVAGVAAKQAPQPVAAAFPLLAETNNGVFTTTTLTSQPNYPNNTGILRVDGTLGPQNIDGIQSLGAGTYSGVYGVGGDGGGAGIFGQGGTNNGTGVIGLAQGAINPGASLNTGVWGTGRGVGKVGVRGDSDSNVGVMGTSDTSIAMMGTSNKYYGLYATSNGSHAVFGNLLAAANSNLAGVVGSGNGAATYGVYGGNANTGVGVAGVSIDGYGVYGQSTSGTGVYGLSATGLYGVVGQSGSARGSAGLLGIATSPNAVGIGTYAQGGATFAGYFNGTTVVNGAFAVTGSKSAAVKDAAGNYRLLYCVESPEAWFEDFGTGKVVNGTADIALDPQFAQLISADAEYHVFITEHDQNNALHVKNRAASGFTVAADAATLAAKGKAAAAVNGTFSWRVVAKRRDIAGERLAQFTMPPPLVPPPGPPSALAPLPTPRGLVSQPSPGSASTTPTSAPTAVPPARTTVTATATGSRQVGGSAATVAPIPSPRP
jgi:hypothetical protein